MSSGGTRGRVSRLAVAIGATALLAGCASSVRTVDAGSQAALPDETVVAATQTKQFDQAIKNLDHGLVDGHPVRGTMFKHASFGAKKSDEEWDVEFLGDPAAIFVRTRVKSGDNGNLDMLHPAASPYDFFLLGKKFASIAHTAWARVPTNYHEPLNVCLITGYQQICDMEDAVTYTAKEHAKVIKRFSRNADGTRTLLTGVTLASLLEDNFLLNIPESIRTQFTPAMLSYQLPARFVIDGKGDIQVASITGTVPGRTALDVQLGFQVTGSADSRDLPALPAASDTTFVTAKTFYADLNKINGTD